MSSTLVDVENAPGFLQSMEPSVVAVLMIPGNADQVQIIWGPETVSTLVEISNWCLRQIQTLEQGKSLQLYRR